jgi:hypothetical protein
MIFQSSTGSIEKGADRRSEFSRHWTWWNPGNPKTIFFPPEVRFQPLEVGCILWTLSQGFFVKYVGLLLQVKGDQVILSISAFCCRLFGEDLRPSRAPSKAKSGCLGAMLTSFL